MRELVPEVMGARESALLHTLDGDCFLRAFYGSWTRKEAVAKAIGIGLSYPVATLDLPDDTSKCEVSIRTAPDTAWRVFTRELEAALTLSVAVSESVESARDLPRGVEALASASR